MVQHASLTGAELHEPKGIDTANSGQVYVADGGGSGDWTALASTSEVNVDSASDLPTPSGGTITLAANTKYVIGSSFSISDTLVFGDNTGIVGNSNLHPTLTYTGSGNMFSGTDVNAYIDKLSVNCASGTVFSFTETDGGLYTFLCEGVSITSCAKIGTWDGINVINISEMGCFDADDGFSFIGPDLRLISLRQILVDSTSASFVGIDLGTSVTNNVEFVDLIFDAPAGAVGISGATGSANIASDFLATCDRSSLTGGLTPLSGISTSDFRWSFFGNNDIRNNEPEGLVSLTGNTTETTISATDTPVKVTGTFVIESETRFTADTTGRLTYDGEVNTVSPIDAVLTLEPASGTAQILRAYIAKNGTIISASGKTSTTDSGDPDTIPLVWQMELTENDFVEIFVENKSTTNNIIVTDAILRIN